MQKIDIQAVRDAQDSKFLAVHVFNTKTGQFRFIDNESYPNCTISHLAEALVAAPELKNVCLLGSLSLLHGAGLTTEMLSEKGAIVSLQALLDLANASVRDYSRSQRPTLKVIGKAINSVLKHWKSGLLAQSDALLNQELNARAVEIMTSDWYLTLGCTNIELVNILHKRITRHVQDETCAYLGALAIRQNDQAPVDAESDVHALIIGKVNYEHKLSDADRAHYRNNIEEQIQRDYVSNVADKADLNLMIKQIRDLTVLKRYQDGLISKVLSQRLDSDLSDKILSAIRVDEVSFAKESPELSKWICAEAYSKQKGMAVSRMDAFNAVVVGELVVNLKKGKINSDLKRELISYLMPLIEDLKFETVDEENAVVLHAIDSITSKPTQLVDAARAQFIETTATVIRDLVKDLVKVSDNQAGRTLISGFCGEILIHLNCSRASENFNDPDKISALFNKEEVSLLSQIELRVKAGPGLFNSTKHAEVVAKPAASDSVIKSEHLEVKK